MDSAARARAKGDGYHVRDVEAARKHAGISKIYVRNVDIERDYE